MNYWEECISEAFEDAGITATAEQKEAVSIWVEGAHDNYGMAHGHDCIPNPMHSEVDDLKRQIKALEESHEKQLYGIKKGVAQRRGVSLQDVSINHDGHVTYDAT